MQQQQELFVYLSFGQGPAALRLSHTRKCPPSEPLLPGRLPRPASVTWKGEPPPVECNGQGVGRGRFGAVLIDGFLGVWSVEGWELWVSVFCCSASPSIPHTFDVAQFLLSESKTLTGCVDFYVLASSAGGSGVTSTARFPIVAPVGYCWRAQSPTAQRLRRLW